MLDLGYSLLSGTISPSMISKLKNLRGLYLETNDLSGQLPVEALPSQTLQQLDVSRTFLEASFPDLVTSLTNLDHIRLDFCLGITGTIPSEIALNSNLGEYKSARCSILN